MFDTNKQDSFEELIASLSANGTIRLFQSDKATVSPDSISSSISSYVPYYTIKGDYAFIKFVVKASDFDENGINYDVRYPIVISINLKKGFLEIRFDGGKFEYKTQMEFISPKIDYCIKWLQDNLPLEL